VLQARTQYPAHGFLAGPDDVRLAELNSMIGRPDVRALFCVRGGYGSLRLLPGIDFETLSRYPKTIVGYSDITALQLAILCKTGLGSLSAGMVAVDWREPDPAWVQPVLDLLSGSVPGRLAGPRGESLQPVRAGRVEGRLIGGNLTTIVRLVGTPFLPSMEGAILFLEDVGEEPYRIDGLLAQLELSGVLDSVGGLIIGAFTEIPSRPDRPSASVDEVLMDYISRMEVPVARNLIYGHLTIKTPVPIGVRARLEVTDSSANLDLLDPLVG
jgi:muramoyltetrapeptide carboxypeptidase